MTSDDKKEASYGAMAPPMESIVEGQTLTGAPESAPTSARGHRRLRSRGGSGRHGGHHSRTASLVENLADILQTIDEVQVERPGEHAAKQESLPTTSEPPPSHRRTSSRAARHSRGASLTEGLLEEVLDVRDAFVDELDKADEGEKEFFFLDMSLAREISILPEDVVRVAEVTAPLELGTEETTTTDPEKHPLTENQQDEEILPIAAPSEIPFSAYLLLTSAVVSLSSVGPLLNVQTGMNPVLKVYWRMSATALCLFPLAASSVYNEGGIGMAMKYLQGPQLVTLLFTAACYATMCVAFVLALGYTAVGNAVILSNSQSVLLLIGKVFVGQRILALEAGGAIFAFAGAALCSIDSSKSEGGEASSENNYTLLGDALAMLSALGGVLYLTFAKTVRPNLNLYLFMFLIMFCGSTMILFCMSVYTLSASSTFHITIDRNVTTGIWGWMNFQFDRLPLELTMVILCNIFGAMGYVRAMQYFDNLIIAVATLLEPVIATLAAVLLNVGVLPGTLGWTGNAMVALGTFAVVYPSASSGKGGDGH